MNLPTEKYKTLIRDTKLISEYKKAVKKKDIKKE